MNKKVKSSQRLSKRIQQSTSEKIEVNGFLGRGRDWYAHSNKKASRGYRKRYTSKSSKTRSGAPHVQRPRVRETEESFELKLLERLDDIEQSLKTLTVKMYTRGLLTLDIDATLTESSGKPMVFRSETSLMSEALYTEYTRWRERDLSDYGVFYLFADWVYESNQLISGSQTILCMWGTCSAGRKDLLGLEAYTDTGKHPAMIKCFQAVLAACLLHLKFPAGHYRYIQTTNLSERAFVEQKRRTKVIPVHINKKGAMKLVYGSLIRAAGDW